MIYSCSHYSGCGNDFLIFDNRSHWFPRENASLIQSLCRQAKVDGLIAVSTSPSTDFSMQFFNNDGKPAGMCGNGARALFRYLIEKLKITKSKVSIDVYGREIYLESVGDNVRVDMGSVQEFDWKIPLQHDDKTWTWSHLDTGVPHIVTFLENVEHVDVATIGAYFRSHPQFQPQGTNVNFVDPKRLRIRTFERGVEAETLACGTGATATGIALHKLYGMPWPITLQVQSGEKLEIDYKDGHAFLTGPANWICDGKLRTDTKPWQLALPC